jgi:hypothetical protein
MTFDEHIEKINKQGQNCDGHIYYDDMGKRLKDILLSKPDYYLGLQNLAERRWNGNADYCALRDINEWVASDIFHHVNIKGHINVLLDVLKDKNVLLIGGDHLEDYSLNNGWRFLGVPRKNCWQEYANTLRHTEDYLEMSYNENNIVLFCASMMSNVLIDDLHGKATLIDIGSVFDVHVGVNSRSYMDKLSKEL